jgi:hypothetical protein
LIRYEPAGLLLLLFLFLFFLLLLHLALTLLFISPSLLLGLFFLLPLPLLLGLVGLPFLLLLLLLGNHALQTRPVRTCAHDAARRCQSTRRTKGASTCWNTDLRASSRSLRLRS